MRKEEEEEDRPRDLTQKLQKIKGDRGGEEEGKQINKV